MRDVEARLAHYAENPMPRANLCARAVMLGLGAPAQGLASASAVALAVPRRAMNRLDAPRGSIVYWRRGSRGFGHCCFALGDHLELSVDVVPSAPGVAFPVSFEWFGENWPGLEYVGWSWWWGRIDTRPQVLNVPGR